MRRPGSRWRESRPPARTCSLSPVLLPGVCPQRSRQADARKRPVADSLPGVGAMAGTRASRPDRRTQAPGPGRNRRHRPHLAERRARDAEDVQARLGIPTVLERPNAHTRFAYELVSMSVSVSECLLPPGRRARVQRGGLESEEQEFSLAGLLCPSEFVVRSFLDEGFAPEKLARHSYGFDEAVYYPADRAPQDTAPAANAALRRPMPRPERGSTTLSRRGCVHPPRQEGTFMIAGAFLPVVRGRSSPRCSRIRACSVLGHETTSRS